MDCAERDPGRVSSLPSILTRHPIYDGIYSRLSPGARIRFGRTCRLAYNSVQDFHSRAFNINRHLRHFFNDPIAFRNMQARLAILISGSNALQFLDSTFYPESDLDLYVWEDSVEEVGHWLMEHEGYSFAPSRDQDKIFGVASRIRLTWSDRLDQALDGDDDSDYGPQSLEVYSFTRNGPNGPLKVQIVAAARSPLVTILSFHSTCVMNCIAFDAAYSIYPQATFEERVSLGMASRNDREAEFAKYRSRGWQLIFIAPPQEKRTGGAPFHCGVTRWVRDRHTWIVPLDTSDLQPRPRLSPTSDYFAWDPMVYNSWKLIKCPDHNFELVEGFSIGRSDYPVVRYEYLVDRGLFHTITSSLKEQTCHFWAAASCSDQLRTWEDATIVRLIDAHCEREKLKAVKGVVVQDEAEPYAHSVYY